MADPTRTTGTILDRIIERRRERLHEERRQTPEDTLASHATELGDVPLDFAQVLREGAGEPIEGARLRLIAEVKRASPSKGVFDAELDAAQQAAAYVAAGASAISVLTEQDHFRGSFADLLDVRAALDSLVGRPAVLRKDFIFDRYQVLESRTGGADALLLIAAILEPAALADLLSYTRSFGMEALVEVHDEAELRAALDAGARVLGVNNRDLKTFDEDLGTFEQLAPLVPPEVTLVAESAIRTAADAARMVEAGAHAILVGEALVTGDNIGATALELIRAEA
jgi:indole-3-glycerol phosphate synthase